MTTVTVNSASGIPPFQIWVCNGCSPSAQQIYICQVATNADFPYTFNLPGVYSNSPFCVKVIDSDVCEVCECFGFEPTPTPTNTPTITPTNTQTPTPTPTVTPSGPCPTPTYFYGSFVGNGFTESATYTLSSTLHNGRSQWVSPNNGTIRWSGFAWEVSGWNLAGVSFINSNFQTVDAPDLISWTYNGCSPKFTCSVSFTNGGCGFPTPTPTTTSTPTITPTTSSIVVLDSDVFLNDSGTPTSIYSYNPDTTVLTYLFDSTNGSNDIANTSNKLWVYDGGSSSTLLEYNITLSPFTQVFNRVITSAFVDSGLCAIDDTTLVNISGSDVYELDITTNVASPTFKWSMIPGRFVYGDYMYTTTNKLIVTNQIGGVAYITQYEYTTGAVEVDINISGTVPLPYGVFEYGSGVPDIFIVNSDGKIYEIMKTSPYTLTLVDDVPITVYGASQIPSKITEHFTPVNASPTPTTTPTITPTITPTNTPTITPTISPNSSPTPTITTTTTPTITPTNTPTLTPTNTVTPTLTPTNTVTPTITPTNTPTLTPTNTITPTITTTLTMTPTPTKTTGVACNPSTDTYIAGWFKENWDGTTNIEYFQTRLIQVLPPNLPDPSNIDNPINYDKIIIDRYSQGNVDQENELIALDGHNSGTLILEYTNGSLISYPVLNITYNNLQEQLEVDLGTLINSEITSYQNGVTYGICINSSVVTLTPTPTPTLTPTLTPTNTVTPTNTPTITPTTSTVVSQEIEVLCGDALPACYNSFDVLGTWRNFYLKADNQGVAGNGDKFYGLRTSYQSIVQYTVDPSWYPLKADPIPPNQPGLNAQSYDDVLHDDRFYDNISGIGRTSPFGITFKEDGTRMYVIARTQITVTNPNTGEPASYQTKIYQYNLSTAWSAATWDTTNVLSYTFSGSRNFRLQNPKWSPDGKTLYVTKIDNQSGSCWPNPPTCGQDFGIVKYTTPVPWRLSTLTEVGYIPGVPGFVGGPQVGQMYQYDFTENGTSIYAMGGRNFNVTKVVINLSTPYDLMTMETDVNGDVIWVPNSEINLDEKVADLIPLTEGQLRPGAGLFIKFNQPNPTYWAMFNNSTLVQITEI